MSGTPPLRTHRLEEASQTTGGQLPVGSVMENDLLSCTHTVCIKHMVSVLSCCSRGISSLIQHFDSTRCDRPERWFCTWEPKIIKSKYWTAANWSYMRCNELPVSTVYTYIYIWSCLQLLDMTEEPWMDLSSYGHSFIPRSHAWITNRYYWLDLDQCRGLTGPFHIIDQRQRRWILSHAVAELNVPCREQTNIM